MSKNVLKIQAKEEKKATNTIIIHPLLAAGH